MNRHRGMMMFLSFFVAMPFGLWIGNWWAALFMLELLLFIGACLDYMKAKND